MYYYHVKSNKIGLSGNTYSICNPSILQRGQVNSEGAVEKQASKQAVRSPAPLTCKSFLSLPSPLSYRSLRVFTTPHQGNQNRARPVGGLETLPASLSLPPSLVMARARFTLCDCSRKPRIAKGHCVRFAQSMLGDTLALHAIPQHPHHHPLISTLQATAEQGSLIKGEQVWRGRGTG